MSSLLCEKRLYNVDSVETAALDVQVIGVDFPTVPFISGEVERLEYEAPKQWERRRLLALAKKARLELAKPRPKTSPYRTRPPGRKLSRSEGSASKPLVVTATERDRAQSERNLLKCSRVSLTIQKERESLTTPMQKNPRLRRERAMSAADAIAQSRPSTSHAALGGDVPSALGVSSQQQESPRPGSGGAEGSPRRSHSAKPSTGQGHIIHNLPKAKSVTHKAAQKTYKTRTSQYAERVKAVRKLQVQAHNELSARLATLNIDLNRDLGMHYQQRNQEGPMASKNMDMGSQHYVPKSSSPSAVCR